MSSSTESPSASSSPPVFPVTPTPKPKHSYAKGRFRFSKVFVRWWWIATLLVATVTYIVTQIPSWVGMRGPLYQSSALIEVKPIVGIDATPARGSTPGSPTGAGTGRHQTSSFLATQKEIITSRNVMLGVLEDVYLKERLGGDQETALEALKKMTTVNERFGTDLLEIKCRHEDAIMARETTVAVLNAYKETRYDLEMEQRKEQLRAMKVALQSRSDRVTELRKRLMDIAEKIGVVCEFPAGDEGMTLLPGADLRAVADKELFTTKREAEALAVQIKQLSVSDQQSVLASAESLKDSTDYIKRLHDRYLLRESELDALKSAGLAKEHPKIKLYRARLEEAEQQLKTGVSNEIDALKHKAALVNERIKKIQVAIENYQDRGVEKAREIQELNVIRKEYEEALKRKDAIELKYDIERTKTCIPTTHVIVHESPEQAGTPATRGREFFITIGTVISLPFSIGLGILLMYIAEAIFPRTA